MGDRVAVLCDGVLQQCAAPRELYRNPGNVFVAGFIGSPAMNLFTLPIVDSAVSLGDWPIQLPREIAGTASEVVVGVRPEHFELGSLGVEMEIDVVEELGADAYLYGRITGSGKVIDQPRRRARRRSQSTRKGQPGASASRTRTPAFLSGRRSTYFLNASTGGALPSANRSTISERPTKPRAVASRLLKEHGSVSSMIAAHARRDRFCFAPKGRLKM